MDTNLPRWLACAVLLIGAAAALLILMTVGIANAAPVVLTNPLWLVP